jgi:deazaflavin-dependent oxidoreductase (nitroreductase family)
MQRKMPLMRVEHDRHYAAVGSAFGAAKDTAWSHNLTANPRVEVQDGLVRKQYRAMRV